jgi:NAD(P)H-nitrite reductase large subunit
MRARTAARSNWTTAARLPYDRLLVATGSSPVPPPLPGTDLPGVLSCWTLDDARQIARSWCRARAW